jgi:hypothetical protein
LVRKKASAFPERFGYFMQEGAGPHTAKETIQALRGVLEELNAYDT